MRADRSSYLAEYRMNHKGEQRAAYLRHRNKLGDVEYNRVRAAWYAKNRQRHRATCDANRARYNEFVDKYKRTHPCARCGEADFRCLDFHHIRGEKHGTLGSDARRGGWGILRLAREIEKCEVICANCHRREHYDEKHMSGPRISRQKIRAYAEAVLSA